MIIDFLTEYAGFWRRTLATCVDGLLMAPLLILLSYLICGSSDCATLQNGTATGLEQFQWRVFLANDILPALLALWFWMVFAATPGKILLDCEIVDARTGERISFKQAVLRYLGYFVSALPLGLGFLWIMWDKRKQGWHDKIAGTVVIIHDEATVPLHQLEENFC